MLLCLKYIYIFNFSLFLIILRTFIAPTPIIFAHLLVPTRAFILTLKNTAEHRAEHESVACGAA